MQVDFSPEIQLVNKLRVELKERNWSIIQLVCSGGQTHFSVTYKCQGKNKTVFPDLVAFKEKQIIIGEIKELFDQKDHDKLIELYDSELAYKIITKNISLRTKTEQDYFSIHYVLINQDLNSIVSSQLAQLVLSEETFELKHGKDDSALNW